MNSLSLAVMALGRSACAFAPKLAAPMLIIPDHMIGAASELEDATHAKRFSRRDGARVRLFEQRQKTSQHSRWSRGAAGYVEVDRDHLGNASDHGIAAGETPSIPSAISDRNDPFG